MKRKADIQDGELLDITLKVERVDDWDDHAHVRRKVYFSDVDGETVALTIFHNNDVANFEWGEEQWYRLENVQGNEYNDEHQLNPSYSLAVTELEESPKPAQLANRSNRDQRGSTSNGSQDGQIKTDPAVGSDSRRTGVKSVEHGGEAGKERTEVQPGNYLCQFGLDRPLESLTVLKYRLVADGGFDGDIDAFTGSAAAFFHSRSGYPVVPADKPATVYAVQELRGSVTVNGTGVDAELVERKTLEANRGEERAKLAEIVKLDVKAALSDVGAYDVVAINSIVEREPDLEADSGEFAASRSYRILVWVAPSGEVTLGIDVRLRLQSTVSAAEFHQRGIDLTGSRVEHNTEVYENASKGTIVGMSETRYTDPVPDLGNDSTANYHESHRRADPSLIEELRERNPPLANVDYGGTTGKQALEFLRLVPTMDQLKQFDGTFHRKVERAKRMLPAERFGRTQKFVDAIPSFPSLDRNVVPVVTNVTYDEHLVDTAKPNLRFGDGRTARLAKSGLSSSGVYLAPDPFDVLALAPEQVEDDAFEFFKEVFRTLHDWGSMPPAFDTETYELGGEFDYRSVAELAIDYDAVVAVVPDQDRLPAGITDPYPELKREFARRKIPSQMVKVPNLENEFTIPNLCAGVIAKAGGIPWRIHEVPGAADCFVGLDVTRDVDTGQHIGATANVVLADGSILASKATSVQQGEKFDEAHIVQFVKDLLSLYVEHENREPRHVVIHRDGRFFCDVEALADRFERGGLDTTFEFVEIRKSGTPRIAEYNGSSYEVADKGVGFLSSNEDHAFLVTTGKPELRADNNVGTPQPLRIVQRRGDTDLRTLVEQVYWLSEAHVGSVSRSTRLPITTYYADRCAEAAREQYLVVDELVRGVPYV